MLASRHASMHPGARCVARTWVPAWPQARRHVCIQAHMRTHARPHTHNKHTGTQRGTLGGTQGRTRVVVHAQALPEPHHAAGTASSRGRRHPATRLSCSPPPPLPPCVRVTDAGPPSPFPLLARRSDPLTVFGCCRSVTAQHPSVKLYAERLRLWQSANCASRTCELCLSNTGHELPGRGQPLPGSIYSHPASQPTTRSVLPMATRRYLQIMQGRAPQPPPSQGGSCTTIWAAGPTYHSTCPPRNTVPRTLPPSPTEPLSVCPLTKRTEPSPSPAPAPAPPPAPHQPAHPRRPP